MRTISVGGLPWLLCLGLATSAEAEELKDPFHWMDGIKATFRGAALTENQMAQILELRKTTIWEREQQIEQEKEAAWIAWRDLGAGAAPVDVAQLSALSDRAHQLDAEKDRLRAQFVIGIRNLLTPEQLRHVSEARQTIKSLDVQRRALNPTVAADRDR
jgi:Spy/CpxP family protein refolding chaperone